MIICRQRPRSGCGSTAICGTGDANLASHGRDGAPAALGLSVHLLW